jgi:hypothetical protein
MAKSQILVPLTGTVVVRDGKRIRPVIGKAFDYTADEIESLRAAGAKFRAAQNETPDEGEVASTTKAGEAPKTAKKKSAASTDDDL